MVSTRDLEIKHLLALRAVAEEGSFGRAATRLGYTQSAVSQQVAGLERVVGAPVFDRPGGPRPVELTPLGHLLLEHAHEVLGRVEAAGVAVERFLSGEIGRLEVGTFQSASNTLLPPVVGRLRGEAPGIDIRLTEVESNEVPVQALLASELDVSFTLGQQWPGVETVRLFDDPYVVVTRADEARVGPVPVEDLLGRPLVGYQPNDCQRDVEEPLRARLGADCDWVFRTNDNGAVVAMVRAGMGWAILPRLAVDLADPTIAVHDLEPCIPPRCVSVSWRADRTAPPTVERFVAIAREEAVAFAEPVAAS